MKQAKKISRYAQRVSRERFKKELAGFIAAKLDASRKAGPRRRKA